MSIIFPTTSLKISQNNFSFIACVRFVASGACLLFAVFLHFKLMRQPIGKDMNVEQIDVLAGKIKSGAKAFLTTQYYWLGSFVILVTGALVAIFCTNPLTLTDENGLALTDDRGDGGRVGGGFLGGALLSALAGTLLDPFQIMIVL